MIPLPENPNVVIFVDDAGRLRGVANNIAKDLKVVVVNGSQEFEEESLGKTFKHIQH